MRIVKEEHILSTPDDSLLYVDVHTEDGDILRIICIANVVTVTRMSDWTTLVRKPIPDWKFGTAATVDQIMETADLANLSIEPTESQPR